MVEEDEDSLRRLDGGVGLPRIRVDGEDEPPRRQSVLVQKGGKMDEKVKIQASILNYVSSPPSFSLPFSALHTHTQRQLTFRRT